MFSEFDCPKELYIQSNSNINKKINVKIYDKYDKILKRKEQSEKNDFYKRYEKIENIM